MMSSDSDNKVRSTHSAEIAKRFTNHMREHDQATPITTETLEDNNEFMQSSASSMTYNLGDESSLTNRNRFSHRQLFDRPAVQGGRNFTPYSIASGTLSEEYGVTVPTVPRSTLCRSSSLDRQSLWYFFAMITLLFSVNVGNNWTAAGYPSIFRAVPSVLANIAAPGLAEVSRLYSYATAHIHDMTQDQVEILNSLHVTAGDAKCNTRQPPSIPWMIARLIVTHDKKKIEIHDVSALSL